YQMLRSSALNIISALGIQGGCNVQFALHPDSFQYAVIEVNPRVSRSSALASKATGYPIARVAAKIALGLGLDEIKNAVTGTTYASFEPALDYCVVKIPKFPFDKFVTAKKTLGTQMKATGEVMAISRSFEAALHKALHSLEENRQSLLLNDYVEMNTDKLLELLHNIDNFRIYVVAASIFNGISLEEIHEITKIDMWFLNRIKNIVDMEKTLASGSCNKETMLKAKQMGFTDTVIAKNIGITEKAVKNMRDRWAIKASFSVVDTCAAEFASETPYYYSDYGVENEVDPKSNRKKVLVLGSGPIRIGQGIEFDYCSVHSVWALRNAGCETIIVNNNPETVSTDFDVSDKLYFEPLIPEYVANIVELEKPDGAIVQFGGQTAIKLTKALHDLGVTILGTDADHVDAAEDRERFDEILEACHIDRPRGQTIFTEEEALVAAHSLGYPVLVRPSYVLGGQGMQIAVSDEDIVEFMDIITRTIPDLDEHPVLVDKYIMGQEVEVDAICDGYDILVPGIMEHIDRAGIHSGDSISVYPAITLSQKVQDTIVDYTRRLASALHVIGMMNIQFIVLNETVYIIEVNPRSSRTVPYISKVTGIPAISLATRAMLGERIKDMGYGTGLYKNSGYYAIKLPVFSFEKIIGADTSLGPEMKSTGEVLGISKDFNEALLKAFDGGGVTLPKDGKIIVTVCDKDKPEICEIFKNLEDAEFDIYATPGTQRALIAAGISAKPVNKITGESPNILDMLHKEEVSLIINTPTHGRLENRDGFKLRRIAVEAGTSCLTSLDAAKSLMESTHIIPSDIISVTDIATL
ncbi:MAG: carbamoyl-phosphate synthase large subunit, partial [Oscillospiraceae bacterium]